MARRDGSLALGEDHSLGLYLDDCRYLRAYELTVDGASPRLLTASDAAGDGAVYELTGAGLSLRLRIERRIFPDAMLDRLVLRSHARDAVELELELRLDADFRPMLEVRGLVALIAREVRREADGDTLTFAATGLDGRERSTTVACPGAVAAAAEGVLRAVVRLDRGEEGALDLSVGLDGGGPPRGRIAPAAAEADAWLAARTRIEVDDGLVARILRRSLLDLRLLTSELDGQRYYSAGVPWYATLFGRDSIITALEMLPFDRAVAEETLRLLGGRLGSRTDDEHDEEPGKVVHELRVGELAARGLTPLARYYGSVDATPLFLCLLCELADWSGSLDLFRELRPQVDRALRWLDEFGDPDGDGLLEYSTRSAGGLVNQGWKDWPDGVVDEHGARLRAPIALVEPQGYSIAARRGVARLLELDGDRARADALREAAARTQAALERLWLSDRGFYALALDAGKRPARVLASNQGHLLWARAVPAERAADIRDALMSEAAYSGWGVRTLGADERAFNPVGYHTGSVWPHDNALIALGLRRYGFDDAFLRLLEDQLEAAASFPAHRLPELFAGFARSPYEDPVPYPVACSPQAWAAGALPALLTAALGLVPDGRDRTLRVRHPLLPRQLDRLKLSGLGVGQGSVDLLFERRAGGVELVDVHADGVRVAVE